MKFLRKVLYIYKKALGICIMNSNIILTILMLNLYFGHTRLLSKKNNIIEINLEKLKIEINYNIILEDIPELEKNWN